MKPIAVITAVGSQAGARAMARAMVERKLAACAQISEIESFYTWDGAVQNDREFRVVFKTTDERYPALKSAIRACHAYALPAIHALPFEQVYAPCAEWIASNSAGA